MGEKGGGGCNGSRLKLIFWGVDDLFVQVRHIPGLSSGGVLPFRTGVSDLAMPPARTRLQFFKILAYVR